MSNIQRISQIVREAQNDLAFTILEIGARVIHNEPEPFHQLLDAFPESQIIACEVDEDLCEELNKSAKPGMVYHPVALGRKEGKCAFYNTNHPMCSSLYQPNDQLNNMYYGLMENVKLKSISSIETVSLDYFVDQNNIGPVDFIKIDIQGAELDVFQGGSRTLNDVTAIVSEVEFVSHYLDQPLFGDVCSFLTEKGMMFHKFLGLAGRTLKPIIFTDNPYYPTQYMWTDAVFIKDIFKIPELSSDKLLKMGLMALIYQSPDLAYYCFHIYDQKNGTTIGEALLELEPISKVDVDIE